MLTSIAFELLFLLRFSMGTVTLELYWKHAPNTCRNFAELTRRGYYNGTKFHRIIAKFMIQGGDPTGTGRVGGFYVQQVIQGGDNSGTGDTGDIL